MALENVPTKNEDGSYNPIEMPQYAKVMNMAKAKKSNFQPTSVVFDNGEYIPIGYVDGELCYFNANKEKFSKMS